MQTKRKPPRPCPHSAAPLLHPFRHPPVPALSSTRSPVGEGFYPSRRSCTMFRAGYPKGTRSAALHSARPAPTHLLMYRVSVPCLSLWERWPSAAGTERVNNDHLVLLFKKAARPSQSPAVTALPKGEPRVCAPLYRRIPAAACTPKVLVPLCSTARSSAPTHCLSMVVP